MQPPIHHTLENATITYDTVTDQATQKDLVKDVFFSPAMATDEDVLCSSAASSCGSQSDCESDESVSTPPRTSEDDDVTFSPPITPTDLLQSEEDQLLFFGIDLFEEEKPVSLCFSRNGSKKRNLPTPQPYRNDAKRRRDNDATIQDAKKQKKHLDLYDVASPSFSDSPHYETLDYFDDASGEESSDDDEEEEDSIALNERPNKNNYRYSFNSHPYACTHIFDLFITCVCVPPFFILRMFRTHSNLFFKSQPMYSGSF